MTIDKDTILKRLNQRLTERGETRHGIAKQADVGPHVFRDIDRMKGLPSWDKLERLRQVLDLDSNFLPEDRDLIQKIGAVTSRDDIILLKEPKRIDDAHNFPINQWDVLEVNTDLLFPVFSLGDQLLLGRRADDISLVDGKDCLVCLNNGNLLLRKVAIETNNNTVSLTLATAPTLTNCKLQWAQPVEWIKRN